MSDTKWCPTCGAEYVAGHATCADCGVPLVDAEPATSVPSSPEVVRGGDEELDAVEFDLTEWPADARTQLEFMLRGPGITFEWIEDGVLAVPGAEADFVEERIEYLAEGPPDEITEESNEWRVTGPETGAGSNELTIDDFYEGDPAREDSEESQFGAEWTDDEGVQCEVSWIHDTEELYLMRAPKWMPFMVEVLDVLPKEEVGHLLRGWETAMPTANSVQWVRDRLAAQAEQRPADDESITP
ncbi:MAG: hypothetical protein FJW86_02240 [Actinobacteria bacterium]|nr:hypothetical protein [Actinomycetota bacterium]